MKQRVVLTILILTVASLAVAGQARADDEAVTDAVAAAEAWLKLVDKGDIDQSWETAAALFKGAVTQKQWNQKLTAARGPMGKIIWRKVEVSKYETSLPGAPDGEYVVIQFKAQFENKDNAVETVVPMKDPDGEWRVSGYYIK